MSKAKDDVSDSLTKYGFKMRSAKGILTNFGGKLKLTVVTRRAEKLCDYCKKYLPITDFALLSHTVCKNCSATHKG